MELSDDRILGSGEFVQKLIDESDENTRRQFKGKEYIIKAKRFIKEECRRLCEQEAIGAYVCTPAESVK